MSDLGTRRAPYSIPDGTEPYPEDRLSWACEQVHHLTYQETFLLVFLCRHAWGRDRESDYYPLGYVRSEWCSTRKIAEATNASRSTVHRLLQSLRAKGYVSMWLREGWRGKAEGSEIKVWWYESDDQMREDVRAGKRPLPGIFDEDFQPE